MKETHTRFTLEVDKETLKAWKIAAKLKGGLSVAAWLRMTAQEAVQANWKQVYIELSKERGRQFDQEREAESLAQREKEDREEAEREARRREFEASPGAQS